MSSDFDDILESLGMGKWNLIYFLGLTMLNFMSPGFFFPGVFIAPSINFTCSTQELEIEAELDQLELYRDECKVSVWHNSTTQPKSETSKCSQWSYTDEYFHDTLTSEFDLVCDDAYLRPTFQTVATFGSTLGSPINGFLSDRFGRKRMLTFTIATASIAILLQSFSYNFMVILILRFICGCTTTAIFQNAYILCMEVCPPKHRTTIGVISSVPWALGVVWWGVLGYLIRDWRWLLRADVVPVVVTIVWLWVIDESPRWMIVRGRHNSVVKCLKKAARMNSVALSSDEQLLQRAERIEESLKSEVSVAYQDSKDSSLKSKFGRAINQITILYRTPEIRKRILLMYTADFVNVTVYCGLTLNAVNFQLDPYMYTVVGGLSEIPAYTLTIPVIAKFGRVLPLTCCYMICGITILILAFIPPEPKWLVITLAMVGKFCISATFQIVILLACEMIPTEVRLQGIGSSAVISSVGAISAPFITELLSYHKWVPSVVFGTLGILGGVASGFIPETLNKHMPDTIQHLEMEAKREHNKKKQEEIEALENGSKASEVVD